MNGPKDITNYDYVNSKLDAFGLNNENIFRIPMYTTTENESFSIKGYELYDSEFNRIGVIFFEDAVSGKDKLVVLFDGNGDIVKKEGTVANYDLSLINSDFGKLRFDVQSGDFIVDIESKSGIQFTGVVQNYPGGVYNIDFDYTDCGYKWKMEQLSKFESAAAEIHNQKFIATSETAKEDIEIPKYNDSFTRGYFCKPVGGMWGAYPSDNVEYVSGWHEWCRAEDFCLNKIQFVTEFNLREDAKVLGIKDVQDLEILASIFSHKPMVNFLTLDSDFGTGCAFVDWNKVAMHYDAIVVSGYISGWDIPSIVVFKKDAIDEHRTLSVDDFLQEKQTSIEHEM